MALRPEQVNLTHPNPRVQNVIDIELAKFARAAANIEQACEDGRISEHDRDERIARVEHWHLAVIAHHSGQGHLGPRDSQPLDDPDAGRVG